MHAPLVCRGYPIFNKLLRTLGREVPLTRLAQSREEICPKEISAAPPVRMDPHDWDLITQFQHETTEAAERQRVAGGKRQHRATLRFGLRNVLATPRGFYAAGRSFNQYGHVPVHEVLTGRIVVHDQGFYALPVIGMKYFGHWLTDALGTVPLARTGEKVYLPANPNWPHSQAYLHRLGIETVPDRLVLFREMSFAIDVGQNSHRRARLAQIRDRLRQTIPAASASCVFLSRGRTGARRELNNEAELADRLSARGFTFCTSSDPLDTLLSALGSAQVVVSMEGSHLAHALMAVPRGALILTINPADRFNTVYADYMEALGHRMATIVAPRDTDGYRVNTDRLLALIDKAMLD
jgi:hypothetical protein